MTTYTARWVLPVAGPPLARGTLAVQGETIVAVEPHGTRTADVDLGNVALIPGLCNAHTHLDLSGARGRIPPTDPDHFTDWLLGVIEYRKTRTADEVQQDIENGLMEALQYGTTLIGDICGTGVLNTSLFQSKLRGRFYRELIGLSGERGKAALFDYLRWRGTVKENDDIQLGASPHAPYSINPHIIRSMAWNGYPMAIHMAESPHEAELLAHHSGPFESFLKTLGVWEPECLPQSHEWLLWRLRRTSSALLIHGNYFNGNERIDSNQIIVVCPRTHAAFGHPRHPFPQFLARGVNVALGTDSLASNPDLDLLTEARELYAKYPEVGGETILKMATLNGAKALGFADVAGSLEPGKSADAVAVPLPDADSNDPYELLLGREASDAPRRTLFRGHWRT